MSHLWTILWCEHLSGGPIPIGTHRFVHLAAFVEQCLQTLVIFGGREGGRGRAVLGRQEGAGEQVAAVVQVEVATPPATGQPANGQKGKNGNGKPHVADGLQWWATQQQW